MKLAIFTLIALFASVSNAAEIKAGRYNAAKKAIELDVVYGGGCEEHSFSLELSGCAETFPVMCPAKLIDNPNGDLCEALVSRKIFIKLTDAGLDDAYYNGARLTIRGDDDSRVSVHLPLTENNEPGEEAAKFSCSDVGGVEENTISIDLDAKRARFFDNDMRANIPFTDMRILESNPPQYVYTFEGNTGPFGKMRITFNHTKLTASVTYAIGTSDQESLSSPRGGCKPDNRINLRN